jgi:hypothetical protein
VLQITADRDLPRCVDEAVGGAEESARNVVSAGLQALAQGEWFHDGDCHPLTVNRIEAAESPFREKLFRQSGEQLFEPLAPASVERMGVLPLRDAPAGSGASGSSSRSMMVTRS